MVRGSEKAVRLAYSLGEKASARARQSAEHEIMSALQFHGGDVQKTAGYLEVGRSTLNRWIANSAALRRELEKARRAGPKR
jgi:DNA-binding NtrC family response regulator